MGAEDENFESGEDNSLQSDPEKDRAWLEGELIDAQNEGFCKKQISKIKVDEMLRIQAKSGYGWVLDLLSENMPDLLTVSGKEKHEEFERIIRQSGRMGEFAPNIIISIAGSRLADDLPATIKQIKYLRDLGVRNERLLSTLGKRQASEVIDKVLDLRETDEFKKSSQKSSGCIIWLLIATVLFLITCGLLILIAA